MSELVLRVKSWRSFQHYKDRNPPWIRLHKSLLDDFEFHCLPVASKALAPMLWLLASENLDGEIGTSVEKLGFRLRMSQQLITDALKPLIKSGFIECLHDASNTLAPCKQDAVPEAEAEALQRQRTEAEAEAAPLGGGMVVLHETSLKPKPPTIDLPEWLPPEVWVNFKAHRAANKNRHGPLTERAERIALNELIKLRNQGHDPIELIEKTIVSGWATFYPPKGQGSNGTNKAYDRQNSILEAGREALSQIRAHAVDRGATDDSGG